MIEFVNRNLERDECTYFYRVSEFATTFKQDEGENDSFCTHKDFKGRDLIKQKKESEKYYYERLFGLEDKQYFLDFAPPEEFEFGENAAFSVNHILVQCLNSKEENEFVLLAACRTQKKRLL